MQNNGLIYNKITDCIDGCKELVCNSQSFWATNICNALESVKSRMQEPMQLAIVGRISSSKSTLVNAILGNHEVVRTGHEAETFNVSWLKYGSDDAPLSVHLKDGTVQSVSRASWANWASHKGTETLKDQVKYIEVYSSNEMLKYINIIDTPGLDATSKVDSENTIDFLRTVHPDAVILLFSKSLSDDTLKLTQELQCSESNISFSLNPMNALGILSKVDANWSVMQDNDIISTSQNAINRTLSSRSDVNKSLFRILPVSALMGLASSYIIDEDYCAFKSLANLDDKNLIRLHISYDFFIREYDFISISPNQRLQLISKYGLYGCYTCIKAIKDKNEISIIELAKKLQEKSGFDQFMRLLVSHFGDRASLIKAQRGVVSLLDSCNKDRQFATTMERQEFLDKAYAQILSIENDLHELKEWSLLLRIYEGKINVDDDLNKSFDA